MAAVSPAGSTTASTPFGYVIGASIFSSLSFQRRRGQKLHHHQTRLSCPPPLLSPPFPSPFQGRKSGVT